jgi:hypothetical protein
MKQCLLAIAATAATILFTSCAGMFVSKTYVATGAVNPRTIYIRPFAIDSAVFSGHHGHSEGELEIRRSLAPEALSIALKEELEKLAPTMILREGEVPETGWIVEGVFDLVDAGDPKYRGIAQATATLAPGRSKVRLHVRVIDVEKAGLVSEIDFKNFGNNNAGGVIYAFDLRGGSELSAAHGSIYSPGLGYATPFDFRNTAEMIYNVLSPDPHRYGVRSSPTIR